MNEIAKKLEGEGVDAFQVFLRSIGEDQYQAFVKDVSSKSSYVRLVFGTADSVKAKIRGAEILREVIVEPKVESGVFLGSFHSHQLKNRKLWIIFETVQRQKGKKGIALERFAGVSPPQSKWKTSIGHSTYFELKKLSLKDYNDLRNSYLPFSPSRLPESTGPMTV